MTNIGQDILKRDLNVNFYMICRLNRWLIRLTIYSITATELSAPIKNAIQKLDSARADHQLRSYLEVLRKCFAFIVTVRLCKKFRKMMITSVLILALLTAAYAEDVPANLINVCSKDNSEMNQCLLNSTKLILPKFFK